MYIEAFNGQYRHKKHEVSGDGWQTTFDSAAVRDTKQKALKKKNGTQISPVNAPLDPVVGHEEADLGAQPEGVVRPQFVVRH